MGEVSFRSNARVLPMARIYLVNIMLLIVTLGLFTPFAVIRSHKYRLRVGHRSHGQRHGSVFERRGGRPDVAATGEGAADLFDFDIGL